jgi:uncharacterized delta-60 repeat protein
MSAPGPTPSSAPALTLARSPHDRKGNSSGLALLLVLLTITRLHALTLGSPLGIGTPGTQPAVSVVDGRPAVAWVDGISHSVKYIRASDADGAAWDAPIAVDSGIPLEATVSLRVVNGNPAICYNAFPPGTVKFARAMDPAGTAWSAPLVAANWGAQNSGCVLEVVDGNPAICFSGFANQLTYARALDSNGTAWAPAIFVNESAVQHPCMKIVQGRPAIACASGSGLWYTRATDAAGIAWGSPVKVASWQGTTGDPRLSMEIVNGRPAISFNPSSFGELIYARAADATGAAWNPPVMLQNQQDGGLFNSLAVINGRPSIGYYCSALGDAKFIQALDSNGDTAAAWGPPLTVDSTGDVGRYASLFEVDGRPALVYLDVSRGALKFLRASTAGGDGNPVRWLPDLVVIRNNNEMIPRGGSADYGIVVINSSATAFLTLRNPNTGGGVLNIAGVTIDGPDAAEFYIAAAPDTAVAPNTYTLLTVGYRPKTPGRKAAVVHILSDAETGGSYDIHLTADTTPDIFVVMTGGGIFNDGTPLTLPLTAPGNHTDILFNVKNPGGAELSGLAVVIDGPDAGEFFLSVPPATSVVPGSFTTFLLRHAPVTGGGKSAALHITNNVPSKNPFDITVSTIAGLQDASFRPVTSPVADFAQRADGRILTGGMNTIDGLLPDGSPDTTFFSPAIGGGNVECIVLQPDGKIMIGGGFSSVNGQLRAGIARLLEDGDLDFTFTPGLSPGVLCIALQPDGKILAGGSFTGPGTPRSFLARLGEDGSLDTSFTAAPDSTVKCLALQQDGKILAGGAFRNISGVPAGRLARLTSGGAPEPFAADFPNEVRCLALQPDGRIFAGGLFEGGVKRLFADGSPDLSVNIPAAGVINSLVLQADGRCLAGSSLNIQGGVPFRPVFRINGNGSLDLTFDPQAQSQINSSVSRIALQRGGGVLVSRLPFFGGPQSGQLLRLQNEPAVSLLQPAGSSAVRWMRGTTVPELDHVFFDQKTEDSSDWTPLGPGHRIPCGWELTGLTLPAAGTLRASGRTGGSLFESSSFYPTAVERWRQQYFQTAANTGDAADSADPDHDGLTNIVEFAFGLSPVDPNSRTLPAFAFTGSLLSASFTAPAGLDDILRYSAEVSTNMLPGTWNEVPDTGAGGSHSFHVPETDRVFVRFTVRMK